MLVPIADEFGPLPLATFGTSLALARVRPRLPSDNSSPRTTNPGSSSSFPEGQGRAYRPRISTLLGNILGNTIFCSTGCDRWGRRSGPHLHGVVAVGVAVVVVVVVVVSVVREGHRCQAFPRGLGVGFGDKIVENETRKQGGNVENVVIPRQVGTLIRVASTETAFLVSTKEAVREEMLDKHVIYTTFI